MAIGGANGAVRRQPSTIAPVPARPPASQRYGPPPTASTTASQLVGANGNAELQAPTPETASVINQLLNRTFGIFESLSVMHAPPEPPALRSGLTDAEVRMSEADQEYKLARRQESENLVAAEHLFICDTFGSLIEHLVRDKVEAQDADVSRRIDELQAEMAKNKTELETKLKQATAEVARLKGEVTANLEAFTAYKKKSDDRFNKVADVTSKLKLPSKEKDGRERERSANGSSTRDGNGHRSRASTTDSGPTASSSSAPAPAPAPAPATTTRPPPQRAPSLGSGGAASPPQHQRSQSSQSYTAPPSPMTQPVQAQASNASDWDFPEIDAPAPSFNPAPPRGGGGGGFGHNRRQSGPGFGQQQRQQAPPTAFAPPPPPPPPQVEEDWETGLPVTATAPPPASAPRLAPTPAAAPASAPAAPAADDGWGAPAPAAAAPALSAPASPETMKVSPQRAALIAQGSGAAASEQPPAVDRPSYTSSSSAPAGLTGTNHVPLQSSRWGRSSAPTPAAPGPTGDVEMELGEVPDDGPSVGRNRAISDAGSGGAGSPQQEPSGWGPAGRGRGGPNNRKRSGDDFGGRPDFGGSPDKRGRGRGGGVLGNQMIAEQRKRIAVEFDDNPAHGGW